MASTIDDKIYEMTQNKVEFSERDLNELTVWWLKTILFQ
jgi:hypothetical protein